MNTLNTMFGSVYIYLLMNRSSATSS